jgi:hypothetical protein
MRSWKESNATKTTQWQEFTIYLSIITLNVNNFDSPTKRQRLVD